VNSCLLVVFCFMHTAPSDSAIAFGGLFRAMFES
jgi:hypothetical protein